MLSRKVGSPIGCINNSESCSCKISQDFTGVGSWRKASWTEEASTSLTWPMGLSTSTAGNSLIGISSLSGYGGGSSQKGFVCLCILHQSCLTITAGTANCAILGGLGSSLHLLWRELGSLTCLRVTLRRTRNLHL